MNFIDYEKTNNWIYPESNNYQPREYQVSICRKALHSNTLVVLPTGLGKTLIASVIMYNFYRWFPNGLIIFVAPTRPLVTQQIEACYNIVGIPKHDTALLMGDTSADKRGFIWGKSKVIFCTPQTMESDISNHNLDVSRISCIVFDEAHRATGSYAYSNIMKKLTLRKKKGEPINFRVLALSATPGNDIHKINEVIRNLHISNIECRFDDDPDVSKYTYEKMIETIRVKSNGGGDNPIQSLQRQFNFVMLPLQKSLKKDNVLINDNPEHLNRSALVEAQMRLDTNQISTLNDPSQSALRALNHQRLHVLQLLYDAKVSVKEGTSKGVDNAATIIERVPLNIQDTPLENELFKRYPNNNHNINNYSYNNSNNNNNAFDCLRNALIHYRNGRGLATVHAQPKIDATKKLLSEHFARHGRVSKSTSAMIFVNQRETVVEVVRQLQIMQQEALEVVHQRGDHASYPIESHSTTTQLARSGSELGCSIIPLQDITGAAGVYAHAFIGQADTKSGKGLNQTEQQAVISSFREGTINTLVSTSIGEEGLDVGNIDLLIQFDHVSSATRLAQRMGRCGRKRTGRVYHLVAEGCRDADKVAKAGQVSESVKRTLRNAMMTTKRGSSINNGSLHLQPSDGDILPSLVPSVDEMQMVLCDLSKNSNTNYNRVGSINVGGKNHNNNSSNNVSGDDIRSEISVNNVISAISTSSSAASAVVTHSKPALFDGPVFDFSVVDYGSPERQLKPKNKSGSQDTVSKTIDTQSNHHIDIDKWTGDNKKGSVSEGEMEFAPSTCLDLLTPIESEVAVQNKDLNTSTSALAVHDPEATNDSSIIYVQSLYVNDHDQSVGQETDLKEKENVSSSSRYSDNISDKKNSDFGNDLDRLDQVRDKWRKQARHVSFDSVSSAPFCHLFTDAVSTGAGVGVNVLENAYWDNVERITRKLHQDPKWLSLNTTEKMRVVSLQITRMMPIAGKLPMTATMADALSLSSSSSSSTNMNINHIKKHLSARTNDVSTRSQSLPLLSSIPAFRNKAFILPAEDSSDDDEDNDNAINNCHDEDHDDKREADSDIKSTASKTKEVMSDQKNITSSSVTSTAVPGFILPASDTSDSDDSSVDADSDPEPHLNGKSKVKKVVDVLSGTIQMDENVCNVHSSLVTNNKNTNIRNNIEGYHKRPTNFCTTDSPSSDSRRYHTNWATSKDVDMSPIVPPALDHSVEIRENGNNAGTYDNSIRSPMRQRKFFKRKNSSSPTNSTKTHSTPMLPPTWNASNRERIYQQYENRNEEYDVKNVTKDGNCERESQINTQVDLFDEGAGTQLDTELQEEVGEEVEVGVLPDDGWDIVNTSSNTAIPSTKSATNIDIDAVYQEESNLENTHKLDKEIPVALDLDASVNDTNHSIDTVAADGEEEFDIPLGDMLKRMPKESDTTIIDTTDRTHSVTLEEIKDVEEAEFDIPLKDILRNIPKDSISTKTNTNFDDKNADIFSSTMDASVEISETVDLSALHNEVSTTLVTTSITGDATDANHDDGDEDVFCCVCASPDSFEDDPILFCDGDCGITTHLSCYGLAVIPAPDEPFYCEVCSYKRNMPLQDRKAYTRRPPRCRICRNSSGLIRMSREQVLQMRQAVSSSSSSNSSATNKILPRDQEWVHPMCALYLPELRGHITPQGAASHLDEIDPDRADLICRICQKDGGCTQCSYANCVYAVHPFCAFSAMNIESIQFAHRLLDGDKDREIDGGVSVYEIFCPAHVQRCFDCEDRLPSAKPHLRGKVISATIPHMDLDDSSSVKGKQLLRPNLILPNRDQWDFSPHESQSQSEIASGFKGTYSQRKKKLRKQQRYFRATKRDSNNTSTDYTQSSTVQVLTNNMFPQESFSTATKVKSIKPLLHNDYNNNITSKNLKQDHDILEDTPSPPTLFKFDTNANDSNHVNQEKRLRRKVGTETMKSGAYHAGDILRFPLNRLVTNDKEKKAKGNDRKRQREKVNQGENNKNNTKLISRYIDDEAELSGSDSGDEYDDISHEEDHLYTKKPLDSPNNSQQLSGDFIDDSTPLTAIWTQTQGSTTKKNSGSNHNPDKYSNQVDNDSIIYRHVNTNTTTAKNIKSNVQEKNQVNTERDHDNHQMLFLQQMLDDESNSFNLGFRGAERLLGLEEYAYDAESINNKTHKQKQSSTTKTQSKSKYKSHTTATTRTTKAKAKSKSKPKPKVISKDVNINRNDFTAASSHDTDFDTDVDNIDKNENEIMEFNNIIHIHKEAETKDENNEGHHTKENTIYKYRDNVPNSTKDNEFHRNADDDSDADDVTVTKPASGTIVKNQQLDIPYGQTDNLWINDDDDW